MHWKETNNNNCFLERKILSNLIRRVKCPQSESCYCPHSKLCEPTSCLSCREKGAESEESWRKRNRRQTERRGRRVVPGVEQVTGVVHAGGCGRSAGVCPGPGSVLRRGLSWARVCPEPDEFSVSCRLPSSGGDDTTRGGGANTSPLNPRTGFCGLGLSRRNRQKNPV